MKEIKPKKPEIDSRRNFLKLSLIAGGATVGGVALGKTLFAGEGGEKVKVMTTDGQVVEVEKDVIHQDEPPFVSDSEVRKGIPNKKFVMVIDLSRCKSARKCQSACQKMHHLEDEGRWLKVKRMQDSDTTAPYWMPQPCFHCDKPPCVKVCPVDATFKREDGIVLIDNERCIGCRFCMAACPYSARSFNWSEPKMPEANMEHHHHSIERMAPRLKGTVEKCDFCPDMVRQGKLPDCVTACPNGVFYYGDVYEDTVTNGDETVRFSELIRDKAGYRYLEDLGAEPSVYYLPPANRLFPFEEYHPEEESEENKG